MKAIPFSVVTICAAITPLIAWGWDCNTNCNRSFKWDPASRGSCNAWQSINCRGKIPGIEIPQGQYKTNKFELKAQQEAGGWVLAWSDDLTETDVINGMVAAGVSIYSGGSSFALWIQELVDRTIQSTMDSARVRFPNYIQNQAESLAQQVIFAAIQGKSPRDALKNFDTVDFKAGAIRYTGGNYLGDQLIGPHTWGMKIYLGFRVRGSSGVQTRQSPNVQTKQFQGYDSEGFDITHRDGISYGSCLNFCINTDECRAFYFVDNKCYLKHSIGRLQRKSFENGVFVEVLK